MAEMGGQIDKMVSFINFEAKNKREEILAKAKQDKEAKKLETVHRERLKIEADFNKKIKNVETMEKIKKSKQASEARMKVLTEADKLVTAMKDEARAEVAKLAESPGYDQLLENLIVEALIRINEPACSLVCRQADLARVKAAATKAAQTFKAKAMASKTHQAVGQKGCKVTVNETTFLEPAPSPGDPPGKPSCCGGIVALNGNSTISCNNTLDARLNIAFEEQLPAIRRMLFGDMVLGTIKTQ